MQNQNNNSRANQLIGTEKKFTRELNAPRQLVFTMWTDPLHLANWWGPEGFTNPVCEVDPRPGGAIHIDMRAPDGTVYPMTGTFVDVKPPDLLSFTSDALDKSGNSIFQVLTTVTFVQQRGGTLLTVTARVVKITEEAIPYLDGMEAGWSQSLVRLQNYLKKI